MENGNRKRNWYRFKAFFYTRILKVKGMFLLVLKLEPAPKNETKESKPLFSHLQRNLLKDLGFKRKVRTSTGCENIALVSSPNEVWQTLFSSEFLFFWNGPSKAPVWSPPSFWLAESVTSKCHWFSGNVTYIFFRAEPTSILVVFLFGYYSKLNTAQCNGEIFVKVQVKDISNYCSFWFDR